MHLSHWLKLRLLPPIGAKLIQGLGRTLRIIKHGEGPTEELYKKGQSIIFVFWHGCQLMMPLVYRGKCIYILISQHRDGELIHRIIRRFGFWSVRGSTTRGSHAALRQLVRLGLQGVDIAITPDGPKGPRGKVQEGVIYLAKMTGMPIVPVSCAYSKKNFFPVGITLCSRIHGLVGCLFGARPFGLMRRHLEKCSNRNVKSLNRAWSRFHMKLTQECLKNQPMIDVVISQV